MRAVGSLSLCLAASTFGESGGGGGDDGSSPLHACQPNPSVSLRGSLSACTDEGKQNSSRQRGRRSEAIRPKRLALQLVRMPRKTSVARSLKSSRHSPEREGKA